MDDNTYQTMLGMGYSQEEAIGMIRQIKLGATFCMALALSEERYGGDAFPSTCLDILEEVYGKRLSRMKPETIKDKIYHMMLQATCTPDKEMITEVVQEWLND